MSAQPPGEQGTNDESWFFAGGFSIYINLWNSNRRFWGELDQHKEGQPLPFVVNACRGGGRVNVLDREADPGMFGIHRGLYDRKSSLGQIRAQLEGIAAGVARVLAVGRVVEVDGVVCSGRGPHQIDEGDGRIFLQLGWLHLHQSV